MIRRIKINSILQLWLIVMLFGCQTFLKPRKVEEKIPPAVTIKTIESREEFPIGYWSEAQIGDYLIQNKNMKIVISNINRKSTFAPSGGNIIDIARSSDNLDYFGEIYFRGLYYNFVKTETILPTPPDNEATLRLSGHSTAQSALLIIQEYKLKPDDNFLRLVTTIVNQTTDTVNLEFEDTIIWGGAMLFVGRRGTPPPAFEIETESEWMCGRIDNYSIGIVLQQGLMKASHSRNVSNITYKTIPISPNSQASIERWLIVGDKDIARITDFMINLTNQPHGFLTGSVIDIKDQKPVADVEIRIRCNRLGDTSLPAYPYTLTYSREDGSFEATVQKGSYFVLANPFGRTAPTRALSIDVPSGVTQVVTLRVSPEIKLSYEIRDAKTDELIPAKLTFVSLPGKPLLDLGPPYKTQGARNTYYAYTGKGELTLPPELFKIIVSRGIEYESVEKEIRIIPGQNNELKVKLNRLLDTAGWICADIGVKTNRSYDSLVEPRDRVISAVCEGVEWLVSGDTNTVTDLQQIINDLKLNKWIKATAGINLDFPQKSPPPGNFLVFPVEPGEVAEFVPQLGAMANWQPQRIFSFLRKTLPNALIQVNRPLAPDDGYFALQGYDKAKGELPSSREFTYDFDLLNIWQGKSLQAMEDWLKLYYTLLENGKIKGLSAGSFARFIYGEETGYPRTYIRSATDEPEKIAVQELLKNLKLGQTIVTNGPFINFKVNGQTCSAIVKPSCEFVDYLLEVFAVPWVIVDAVSFNKNGSFEKMVFLPPVTDLKRYPRGEESRRFPVKEESFLNISVKGSQSLEPIVSPISFPEGNPMTSFAVSGPIFIDMNGNGKFDPSPTKK